MTDTGTPSTNTGEPQGDPVEGTEGTTEGTALTVEDLQKQIEELKGHSRKWEDRAKENYEARQELDKVRKAQMSDEERRAEEVAATEKRAKDAEERAEKAALDVLRYKIATRHGISDEDAELFLTGSDEETIAKQAERFTATRSSSTGPRPNPAQGKRHGSGPSTPKDAFGDFLDSNFA